MPATTRRTLVARAPSSNSLNASRRARGKERCRALIRCACLHGVPQRVVLTSDEHPERNRTAAGHSDANADCNSVNAYNGEPAERLGQDEDVPRDTPGGSSGLCKAIPSARRNFILPPIGSRGCRPSTGRNGSLGSAATRPLGAAQPPGTARALAGQELRRARQRVARIELTTVEQRGRGVAR